MTAMTVNILFTRHTNLVEKVKLTKLPMACLIASTTHQDKEWSIYAIFGRSIDIAIEPVGERQSII
jgi:hypothetical protein